MNRRVSGFFVILTIAASLGGGSYPVFAQQHNIEVPFLFEHKLVFVKTKINGHGPFNMLLDTGSDISAINLSTAHEIGLTLGKKGQQAEGAGTQQALFYKAKLGKVEVGDLVMRDLQAAAIDLSKISQALHTILDGVLGYNSLQGRVFQIDYPKRILRFFSSPLFTTSSRHQDPTHRVVLPFRQPEYGPVLDEVYINGQKIRAAIDTGSGDTFKLTPEAVKNLRLEKDAEAGELVQGMGYNGETQNRRGKVKSLSVGTILLEYPTITFFAKGPLPGAIGNGFLENYVVTFDYRSKVIVFERP